MGPSQALLEQRACCKDALTRRPTLCGSPCSALQHAASSLDVVLLFGSSRRLAVSPAMGRLFNGLKVPSNGGRFAGSFTDTERFDNTQPSPRQHNLV
jgi:hypothetical protein